MRIMSDSARKKGSSCCPAAALLLLLLLLPTLGGAETPAVASGTITVVQGEVFYVSLESNRTTGFQWRLGRPFDEQVLQYVRTDYRGGHEAVPGAGGIELWVFRAVGRGSAQLFFEYARPWEKEKTPSRIAAFDVTVSP